MVWYQLQPGISFCAICSMPKTFFMACPNSHWTLNRCLSLCCAHGGKPIWILIIYTSILLNRWSHDLMTDIILASKTHTSFWVTKLILWLCFCPFLPKFFFFFFFFFFFWEDKKFYVFFMYFGPRRSFYEKLSGVRCPADKTLAKKNFDFK